MRADERAPRLPARRHLVPADPRDRPEASADFYEAVFGWKVRRGRPDPAFEDGTGHVIGHFRSDHAVAGEGGVRPYVFVESLDDALERIRARGCEVVEEPYPEGDLWVALFRDPAGNVVGAWQHGPRT